MARFKCDACGFDGEREWQGQKACRECGEIRRLRVAFTAKELTGQEVDWLGALMRDEPRARWLRAAPLS